ncbi:MAG: NAD(P)-binding domain-containing protein [Saprospiraceae bacterium]|nr:NAD(P)-binding domain-containing protein [Saprospiraceae bacterium]
MMIEQIVIYGITFLLCAVVIWLYLRQQSKVSEKTSAKIAIAKEEGRYEPISLHPYIDLNTCIGSGACVRACPEKDILGLVNGRASVINASSCIGHGACFHACPVEAISLRIGTEKRGVELPHVNHNFETNVPGIFIAGELGGMGLIKNSVEQGRQAMGNIVQSCEPDARDYDVIIIGAGPAGISASLEAKKSGLKCITLEQDTLGGTVYSFPRSKIVMTAPMDLPLYGEVKLFDTSKDELLKIWHEAISKNDLKIFEKKKVESIEFKGDNHFIVNTAQGDSYNTSNVLIAIGRRGTPRKLGIEGESLPKVSYRLLEPENITGKDIIVVGGGDSAIESALLLCDNNNVTLSYRKDAFARLKPKNRERISQADSEHKINVVFNSNLLKVEEDNIELKIGEDEIKTIKNDLVYIFIGGELPTKFLQNAGIEISKRFGYIVKKHA